MMKKVVIISRAIYPHQSPRPMRATELAKEFVRQGYDVTLYGLLGKFNYQNFIEKTGVTIKSLGNPIFSKQNSDESHKYNLLDKVLSKFFQRLLEFPSIELMFMVNKVLKKETDIDLLITVAIPYPIHWGAAFFRGKQPKKSYKYTWIADCGDPYIGNPFHKKPFYFKYVEKWFCRKADYLTVPVKSAIQGYYKEFHHKIRVIPQGFNIDLIDYKGQYKGNDVPTFIYAGVFYENIRDPRTFLDYLATIDDDFKFIIYTRTKRIVTPYEELLKNKLIVKDYIPREDLLVQMSKADFLINFENNTSIQSPSKLIDYGLVGRPVLSINFKDSLDTESVDQFLSGDYSQAFGIGNLEQYNIKNVVRAFINLIKNNKNETFNHGRSCYNQAISKKKY